MTTNIRVMNKNGNLVSCVSVWNSDSEIGKMDQIENACNIKITVLTDKWSEEISVICFHLHLDLLTISEAFASPFHSPSGLGRGY